MLKLLRLEDTSVFAIIDDEQIEGEMNILGYVQMNFKDGKPFTKIFEPHGLEWFEQLNMVIMEKEKSLATDIKYIRRALKLENIVIQYLREKGVRIVKIDVIKTLVRKIALEINASGSFFKYWDYYQLVNDNVTTLLKSSKRLKVNGEDVSVKNYFTDIICYNPETDVDNLIKERAIDLANEKIDKVNKDMIVSLAQRININTIYMLENVEDVENYRKTRDKVLEELATKIYKSKDMFFLGRGIDQTVALEGSLKLKEISYIHSEAYPAGELKHGPIALIENGVTVISILTDEFLVEKTISNIQEVITRGAQTLVITNKNLPSNNINKIVNIPDTHSLLSPIVSIIPLQLLSYFISKEKGLDVDKPRNLAKSVTVE